MRITDVRFSGPVAAQQVKGIYWQMAKELVCSFVLHEAPPGFPLKSGNQHHIRVPVGFRHDFASTPWPLRKIGRHSAASVVHDYLYRERWPEKGRRGKEFADLLFLEGMKAKKVYWWKRNLMYAAVVVFGGRAWRT